MAQLQTIKILFLLALLPGGSLSASSQNQAPDKDVSQAAPEDRGSTADRPGEKQKLLLAGLETRVNDIAGRLDGVMAVAILDLPTGDQVLLHPDEVMPQASCIKLAVLANLYLQDQQASAGVAHRARLTDLYTFRESDLVPDSQIMAGLTSGVTRVTNRDLATFMVAVSDNSATNILIDRLGMSSVNQMLAALGLQQTRLRRKMMDLKAAREGRENTSTPREMMKFLEAIYRAKIFDKARTADFFKVLSTLKDSYIPRLLPDDIPIAEKPGSLEAVRADSGIVFLKNRPFVICVMTTYLKDEKAGEMAIGQVALAAYQYFDRVGRSSSYGRVISAK